MKFRKSRGLQFVSVFQGFELSSAFGFQSLASLWASAICADVIFAAILSRVDANFF